MTKVDKEKIFESYRGVISEAGFGMPTSPAIPSAMTGSTPTGGFTNKLPSTPPVTPSSPTNPIPSGAASQNANMASQIASLDAKLNTLTTSIENLTTMVAKLIMPEKRLGPTTQQYMAPSVQNKGAIRQ